MQVQNHCENYHNWYETIPATHYVDYIFDIIHEQQIVVLPRNTNRVYVEVFPGIFLCKFLNYLTILTEIAM